MLMLNFKNKSAWTMLGISLVLLLMLWGCEKNSPVSPEASLSVISQAVGSSSIEAASDIGTIWILQDAQTSFAKEMGSDSLWQKKKYIKSSEGGSLEIGDSENGRSSINFNEHALPQDTMISMKRRNFGDDNNLPLVYEFGPEGTVFNNTVTVTLSYRDADLRGVPEDNLRIFYYNPVRNLWELKGGIVDKVNKTVSAELQHFSRYAIAFS
jgi:hypothetical protein